MSDLKEHKEPTISLEEIVRSAGYVAGAGVAATVGGVVGLGCERFDYEAWAESEFIPEPATMSLLALGAVGIIARRKRR